MNLNPGPGGAVAPRRKEVVYPVIGAAEQSKAPHSFKMPDWSGAASFPKMDDAKSYGRKRSVRRVTRSRKPCTSHACWVGIAAWCPST